jgi:hypothetical protein
MKKKHCLLILAAVLVASAALVYANRGVNAAAEGSAMPAGRAAEAPSQTSPNKVIAYYFHVTARCATCRTIETHSKEAIERGFAAEIKGGTVEWRPVNVQLPENRHFIQDYRLFTRSVVLAKMKDGKQVEWRNLEKVWDLVGRKDEFLKYVQTNVKEYLGGG